MNLNSVGLRLHRQPAVLAGGGAEPGRRDAAAAVHVRGADVRRPQLDGGLGAAPARADARPRLGREQPGHAFGMMLLRRRARRRRRRQLRIVDDEHLLVLPGEGEGLGARPQRRRRQHRRRRGAGAVRGRRGRSRPASASHLERAGLLYVPLVLLAAVLRVALHGQPVGRQGRLRLRAPRRRASAAHLGDVVPLHRHLRLVHRLRRRVPAADQGPVPRGQHRLAYASSAPSSARWSGRSAAGSPTASAARGSPRRSSSRWGSACSAVVVALRLRELRPSSSRASCCCSSRPGSATARPTG